jgi:hypothetical protein
MAHILDAKAKYDYKTDCYFGRVNIHLNGRMTGYRVVRVARRFKEDALADALLLQANMTIAGINVPININDYI